MRLAKPRLDIGLFTNRIADQKVFWGQTAGLRFDHELELRSDWKQHRYDAHGSVIKVNHLAGDIPALAPTGYAAVSIAQSGGTSRMITDTDGNEVRLVAPGMRGITHIGITVRTPQPERMMRFYCDAMEFERVEQYTARCGDTLIFVEEGLGGAEMTDLFGMGYRYLTVQIFDADKECDAIVARGGRLARPPVSFGDVARYGFVKDPDGNWIEVSARSSLIGAPSSK